MERRNNTISKWANNLNGFIYKGEMGPPKRTMRKVHSFTNPQRNTNQKARG
jgi:CRISPR/Cas system-associated protein Cas7 (RAMP superfamily)